MIAGKIRSVCLELLPVFLRKALRDYRTRRYVPNALGREFSLPEKTIEEIFHLPVPSHLEMAGAYIQKVQSMCSPAYELLNIAAISALLKPAYVFEIGTYVGVSALIIAKNVGEDAKIYTLDLPPEGLAEDNIMNPEEADVPYRVGELLNDEPAARKVKQLYGDSTQFDFSLYEKKMDLIFVDGNHEYEFVKSDSINAFKMLRRGGCIIWDDYYYEYGSFWCAGVTQYLNEIADEKKIVRLAGTRLGIYFDAE